MKKLVLFSIICFVFSIHAFTQDSHLFRSKTFDIFCHVQTVWGAVWNNDGSELYTCGGERQIAVINPETGEIIRETESLPFENYPKGIALNSSNQYVAYYIFNAYENDPVKIHNALSLEETASIDGFETVADIAFSPSGNVLYVSGFMGDKQVIAAYNVPDGSFSEIVASEAGLWSFDISPDGFYIVAAITTEKHTGINIYDMENLRKIKSISYAGQCNVVKFSRDGKSVAAGFYNNTAVVWSVPEGELKFSLKGFEGSVSDIDFSPDGKHIAITGMDPHQTFAVYSAENGELVQSMKIDCPYMNSVAWSPDGGLLALTYTNWGDVFKVATIRIFSLEDYGK